MTVMTRFIGEIGKYQYFSDVKKVYYLKLCIGLPV